MSGKVKITCLLLLFQIHSLLLIYYFRINGLKEAAHINCEGKKGVMGIHLELWKRGHIRVGDEVLVA